MEAMRMRDLRLAAIERLNRAFVRWGLLRHPYGREYARTHYTLLGGQKDA